VIATGLVFSVVALNLSPRDTPMVLLTSHDFLDNPGKWDKWIGEVRIVIELETRRPTVDVYEIKECLFWRV